MTEYPTSSDLTYGPVPFWFINGEIRRENISFELDAMRSKGITEVIVHPRYGLAVDYLSEEWFQIFGCCLEEAKALGMRLWIYDELNWPSGTAGMTVQAADPRFMSKHLAIRAVPRRDIDLTFFEPGQFLIAGRLQGGRITKTRALSDLYALRALDDSWLIFNCHIKRDRFYIDTLSKAAVNCFKERTHEQYRSRFGNEFGKTIRGFFTDEPSIYWVSVGYDDWTIPYTERLFQSFEDRYHYSAVSDIPYLFFPGRKAHAFRADFWHHVSDLFNTNYHANLARWCRDNGLIYSGHSHCEEPLRYQVRFQGDMFAAMKNMDIPGVDHLEKETLGSHWISILGHKIASSSAHTSCKPRVLSESFGVTGWDVDFLDLKKILDWQFAHGVNMIVPHALFHTIAGPAKRESPPSFFIQTPQWQDFDAFSDYINRLSDLLSGGHHVCKILILYPLSGLFAAYQPDRKTQEFECIDSFLNSLCIELMKRQLDYDLIDLATLEQAELNDGRIKLGDEVYDVLIVPYTPYMRPSEYQTIGDTAKRVETYFFYRTADLTPANAPSTSGSVRFVPTEDLPGFVMRLRHSIDDGIHLTGTGREDILLLQREKDGRRIAFLANRSDHTRKITARITGNVGLTLIEPETGTAHQPRAKIAGRKTETSLHFSPHQSWVLLISEPSDMQQTDIKTHAAELKLDNLSFETGDNAAAIFDFYYMEGNTSIDVRDNPRVISVHWDPAPEDFERFAGAYTADLRIEGRPGMIRMVVDLDYSSCQTFINDQEVIFPPARSWLLDPSDLAADVTHLLQEGTNSIRIISPYRLSEPVRFTGDFDIAVDDGVVTIKPRGERDPFHLADSMPFYSGVVAYSCDFELSELEAQVELDLEDARGSAAVYLNGQLAGKRLWPPYIVDITDFVKQGRNELRIELRNNLANLILGRRRPFGLKSMPRLSITSRIEG